MPLLFLHFKEVAHYQDIALAPDWETYDKLEANGALRIFTARDQDMLVGYCAFFLKHNPHYKNSLNAAQDVLFVDPTQRGFGAKFIVWCDRQLATEGVQVVQQHVKCKPGLDFGPLLKRLGYEPIDTIWCKRLDRGASG